MGYGEYSIEAHRALTSARAELPTQSVFRQRGCHPLMDPRGVQVRECRDSPEHPSSLAVVFALDVTGSMGEIPNALARRELPRFMEMLIAAGIAHPQVLFMGVGDAFSDGAPLQVGQFESTAELMDQWLTASFLEGGGGRGEHESYELALYFAAHHTALDCFEKRRERGYLFLTGDEKPYPFVSRIAVERLVGDKLVDDLPTRLVVRQAVRSYEPFFLIPDPSRASRCERGWRDLIGDNVICMSSPGDTCLVAASIVALDRGAFADVDALAKSLRDRGVDGRRVGAVIRALLPWAASKRLDGAPLPVLEGDGSFGAGLVDAGGASGLRRLRASDAGK